MKKQKIDLAYFIANFDLKKFIKFLDKKFEKSMTTGTIIIDELYNACSTKKIGYKKLIKEHNLSDFNLYDYFDSGLLLPSISLNFQLEKESFKSFDDLPDFEYFYSHQIISSKINKSYYLLVNRNVAPTDIDAYYCRKKFKDKKKAILFLKEEEKRLKRDPR